MKESDASVSVSTLMDGAEASDSGYAVDLVAVSVRMRPMETFIWRAKRIMPTTHMVLK